MRQRVASVPRFLLFSLALTLALIIAAAVGGRLGGTPPVSGVPIRVPWSVVLRPAGGLLGPLVISQRAFKPSETRPAVVIVTAGRVLRSGAGNTVLPVLRLDVELWTGNGKRLALLTRLRDLLPGRYAIGLTGRGTNGKVLNPGAYSLRVFAWPTSGGPPSTRSIDFRIR